MGEIEFNIESGNAAFDIESECGSGYMLFNMERESRFEGVEIRNDGGGRVQSGAMGP